MISILKRSNILYSLNQIRQIVTGFIFFHIFMAIFMLLNDYPYLFLVNLTLACFNLISLIFVKKEKMGFCVHMIFLVGLIYTTSSLYYFGWGYGFTYFTLPIITYCYLSADEKWWVNYLVAFFGCIYNVVVMYLFSINDYSLGYKINIFNADVKFISNVLHGSIVGICFILMSNMLRVKRLEELESKEALINYLDKSANIDYLTGLKNRWYFIENIEDLDVKNNVNLAIVDIDYFKRVNDTYGHSAGDEVLKLCANLMLKKFREYTDFICRWGGEEFLIFSYKISQEKFIKICEEFRIEYEQNAILELNIKSSVSIGALYIGQNFASNILDEYITKVDECLYQAKNLGRNRIVKK
ncbi:GGDEF domain-containing protein [Campylobacter sp. MG1]|uniref:GGDEF domain-containing protein n=1 Tax=Campylobacter sp. MG1 TaxID=2976332 RepID=UPI00226C7D9A|nr:GGDEF domain-containing protein [Campylobacter sp. MG1]